MSEDDVEAGAAGDNDYDAADGAGDADGRPPRRSLTAKMNKYLAVSQDDVDRPDPDDPDEDEMSGDNPDVVIQDENNELITMGGDGDGDGDGGDTNDEDDEVFQETSFSMKGLDVPTDVLSDASSTGSSSVVPKTIHQIARDGDVNALRGLPEDSLLLKRINDYDEKKLTPLHYAARYSNLEMLKVLLELGADINKPGDDDMMPIHYAARYGKRVGGSQPRGSRSPRRLSAATLSSSNDHVRPDTPDALEAVDAVLAHLISQGADVNAEDAYKLSPLHHAAIRGNLVAMKRLLLSDAIDKEPKDVQDCTPLHLAATYNHYDIARLLLDGGADPRSSDTNNRKPLHEACCEGNAEIAQLLLEEGEAKFGKDYAKQMLRDKDDDGDTALLLGVASGQSQIAKILLERKANVNTTNHQMAYPIHSAARTGDLETLTILVNNHAHLNSRNSMQQTPLYLAASNNQVSVINFLVENGADVNLYDSDGHTPLISAAYEGHLECVRTLIELGATLDHLDKDDKSVLFHAAAKNRPDVVELLLEHPEGDYLQKLNDQFDNLPIHIAAAQGNLECVEHLLKKGSDIDNKNEDEQTPLHLAAIHGRDKVVELILNKDINAVNDEDEDSNTALHLACMNRKSWVVALLLEKGADVQNRNAKKWTPLDCAASVGATTCAKLLLENDAPIDPMDRSKTTPLHLAAQNGHEKMILLLLKHGANIAMEDMYGRNMLELAILSRKRNVVRAVLAHPDWRKAMRTTYTVLDKRGTHVPETPMRLLVRIYPDLAGMVFDQCVRTLQTTADGETDATGTGKPGGAGAGVRDQTRSGSGLKWQHSDQIKLDYEFIDDAFYIHPVKEEEEEGQQISFRYGSNERKTSAIMFDEPYDSNAKVIMDNHPLLILAKEKRKDLLRHPLCLGLLRHKWHSYGRYVYYGELFLYTVFLAFLTTYILTTPNPANYADFYGECLPPSFVEEHNKAVSNADTKPVEAPIKGKYSIFLQYAIMALGVINALKEFLQIYRSRSRYIQFTNFFDWVVYILAFLLVYDFRENSSMDGFRECWQWELGATTIVLAWLNLLGDIRQFPFLGIYVIMFFHILKTFLRFAVVFMVFIVAFGLGFHILIIKPGDDAAVSMNPFDKVFGSFLKTAVMMIGEFEFEGIFYASDESNIPFPVSTYAMFVLFLVVMSILIMNLLVGLAVDDIKAVMEQAVIERLKMQVELVLNVERMLPNMFVRRYCIKTEVITKRRRYWWSVFADVVSSRSIVKDVTGERQEVEMQDILERQERFEESLKQLKSDMKTMAGENKQALEMLTALLRHSDLSVKRDDYEEFML